MRAISGKSVVNDKAVALWVLSHRATKTQEYYIVREFESYEKMKLFYDNIEISKDRFAINRIKIAFCNHKETKDVISSNRKYKYEVCVKCGYGIHESLLTEKEEELNRLEINMKFSKFDVNELKSKINSLEDRAEFLKGQLSKEIKKLNKLEKLHAKMKSNMENEDSRNI